MDGTDIALINLLGKNSNMPAAQISKELTRQKISLSERGVRKRIKSLQKHGIITGYTIILNNEASGKLYRKIVFVKFKNIKNFRKRVQDYQKYILNAPYCVFAVRLRADYY